jgi:hypothetical protein
MDDGAASHEQAGANDSSDRNHRNMANFQVLLQLPILQTLSLL